MKFSELKVPMKKETKTITINDNEIIVRQSLTTNEIYDLIMITLQESKEGYIYNPFKIETYFAVNLVMMLTDIEFEAEDRIDKFATYNELENAGILQEVTANIPFKFFTYTLEMTKNIAKELCEYENRVTSLLMKAIEDLPKNAEAAAKIVEEFDPAQFQKVIDFATAANGGRPIGSN